MPSNFTIVPTIKLSQEQHQEFLITQKEFLKAVLPHKVHLDPHLKTNGFIALYGVKIAGFVQYTYEASGTAVLLDRLFVRPEFQGTGLARQLVLQVKKTASENGVHSICWSRTKNGKIVYQRIRKQGTGKSLLGNGINLRKRGK
ncbi:MAG: GNAT family N-acetyltransferase [Candidatus ainarchaeum sp.]|nr:GNAT family N-acetyltransferase [Candidatus ainarchaeum sp.]